MVAISTQQAEQFVRAPGGNVVAVLVHGPDTGLVSERAQRIAAALAKRDGEAGEIIRIEEPDLAGDPDRLVVELQTLPMFGGSKVIRTTAGGRINAALFKSLFADGQPAAALVCEAGNLRQGDALRKLFEAPDWAAAVACYGDDERGLAGLVHDMMKSAGLAIDADAVDVLVSRLGADRALSRGEIDKLILYCTGRDAVRIEDIEAIVGDATDTGLEKIAIAAASGETGSVVVEFDRALNAGEDPQAIILVAQRYFQRLHRVRSAMDTGKSSSDVLRTFRPPMHFKVRDAIGAQCRLWPTASLTEALRRITDTARQARLAGDLDAVLAERLLFNLAAHIAQRKRRPAVR